MGRSKKIKLEFNVLKNFTLDTIGIFSFLSEYGFYFDEIHPSMFYLTKTSIKIV